LANDFEININNKVDIIILEVLDLRIFQRDQVFLSGHVENRLKFVYFDPKYVEVCGNFDKNEGSRKREKRIEGTRRRRGIRREEKASTARVPKENA
jgi:Telomerase holoenzyme, Est3 subunit.